MKYLTVIIGGILIFLLAGCGTSAPSAAPVLPTEPPISSPTQTEAPPPTATFTLEPSPTVAPTATPENQIFRDDFTGGLQTGWNWENENHDRWSITPDGLLQIVAEDPSLLAGQPQSNTLWRDLPEGNFAISAHVNAVTTTNFQQAAIFLYEDINNYVAINRGYCAPCFPGQDGNGIFMDYKINGQGSAYKFHVDQSDVYLRLIFEDNSISSYYALTTVAWERLGRFGNYFHFKRVGLGAANIDQEGKNEDLVAQYDYFEITKP